jgi:hypothetical protein
MRKDDSKDVKNTNTTKPKVSTPVIENLDDVPEKIDIKHSWNDLAHLMDKETEETDTWPKHTRIFEPDVDLFREFYHGEYDDQTDIPKVVQEDNLRDDINSNDAEYDDMFGDDFAQDDELPKNLDRKDDVSSNDAVFEDDGYENTEFEDDVIDVDDTQIVRDESSDEDPSDPLISRTSRLSMPSRPSDSFRDEYFRPSQFDRFNRFDGLEWAENLNIKTQGPQSDYLTKQNYTRAHRSTPVNTSMSGSSGISDHEIQKKISKIVSDFLSRPVPTDTMIIKGLPLYEIPSIICTLDQVKNLIITHCGLVSLKNLPPKLERLDIRYNDIQVLLSSDLPATLIELIATKNCIHTIDLSDSTNMRILNLSNNPFTDVIAFPPNVDDLCVTACDINNTKALSKLTSLSILKINMTHILSLDDIPDSVMDLSASKLKLNSFENNGVILKLPKKITKFVCHSSGISGFAFDEFPPLLKYLDLYDNDIVELPKLPDLIERVDISKNSLTKVANIPTKVKMYECNDNDKLMFTSDQLEIIAELRRTPSVTFIYDPKSVNDDSDFWTDPYAGSVGHETSSVPTSTLSSVESSVTGSVASSVASSVVSSVTNPVTGSTTNPVTDSTKSPTSGSSHGQSNQPVQFGRGRGVTYNNGGGSIFGNLFESNRPNGQGSGGFGNFGPRSLFNIRFGNGMNQPQFPPHIMKLIQPDGFHPSRNPARRVKHAFTYYV